MTIKIGLSRARRQLGALMQRAAQGETVTLTRRGRPVAEIRALRASFDAAAASQAVDALRRWRQGLNRAADERQDGAGP